MADNNQLGILARRRIEAEIIKPIYDILVRDIGAQKAAAVIGEAVSNAAIEAGRDFARRDGGNTSIASFVALQPLWEKDNALTVEVIDSGDGHHHYDVTRCRYAEMYRDMGLGDIGHLLSCQRDAQFIVGYAPQVRLTRTATIMQGASRCDFRYDAEPDEAAQKARS